MARTKEFDVDAALDKAVDLFWRKGYAATSMSDLVEYLGINRGSLYATFDSKGALYQQALERYAVGGVSWMQEQLRDPASTASLRDRLDVVLAASAVSEGHRGCLLLNTATECNAEDPGLRAVTTEKTLAIREVVLEAIAAAQDEGDPVNRLAPGVTPAAAADLIMALMNGMRAFSTFDLPDHTAQNAITLGLNAVFGSPSQDD